jgi:MerR family transcriptional regulator/heat shock protein HspR
MEEMNRQMQSFVEYVRTEMLSRFQAAAPGSAAMVPLRKPGAVAKSAVVAKNGSRREG